MGCAMEPASSVNCAVLSLETSSMRFTGREFMSELNSCAIQTHSSSKQKPVHLGSEDHDSDSLGLNAQSGPKQSTRL